MRPVVGKLKFGAALYAPGISPGGKSKMAGTDYEYHRSGYEQLVFDQLFDMVRGRHEYHILVSAISKSADRVFIEKSNGHNSDANEAHLRAQIKALELEMGIQDSREIYNALTQALVAAVTIMAKIGV